MRLFVKNNESAILKKNPHFNLYDVKKTRSKTAWSRKFPNINCLELFNCLQFALRASRASFIASASSFRNIFLIAAGCSVN